MRGHGLIKGRTIKNDSEKDLEKDNNGHTIKN